MIEYVEQQVNDKTSRILCLTAFNIVHKNNDNRSFSKKEAASNFNFRSRQLHAL